jgi:hypothetical protein
MCIIAIKPSSKAMFSDETIQEMFSRNRDGAGIMFTQNGKVHIKKGFMTVDSVLDYVHSRDWSGVPVVMHFRIGTAGPNNELNCHPYPIGMENCLECDCDVAMAHNGILSKYNPPRGSQINDTQVFVNRIISRLPADFLNNQAVCELISNDIGSSKLAFLTQYGKISRFGDWIEDDGYYFSNSSYKPFQYRSFEIPVTSTIVPKKNKKQSSNAVDDDPCTFESLSLFDDSEDVAHDWVTSPTLSFANKFCYDEATPHSEEEYESWVRELDRKMTCIDTNYWEDFEYFYEADPVGNIIYRYPNDSEWQDC